LRRSTRRSRDRLSTARCISAGSGVRGVCGGRSRPARLSVPLSSCLRACVRVCFSPQREVLGGGTPAACVRRARVPSPLIVGVECAACATALRRVYGHGPCALGALCTYWRAWPGEWGGGRTRAHAWQHADAYASSTRVTAPRTALGLRRAGGCRHDRSRGCVAYCITLYYGCARDGVRLFACGLLRRWCLGLYLTSETE